MVGPYDPGVAPDDASPELWNVRSMDRRLQKHIHTQPRSETHVSKSGAGVVRPRVTSFLHFFTPVGHGRSSGRKYFPGGGEALGGTELQARGTLPPGGEPPLD